MANSYIRISFGILNIFGLLLLSFIPWPTPPPIFIGLPAIILQLIAVFYKIEYVHMVWRWIRYEPVQPPSKDDKLPFISIVIPVFNESEFVKNSIKSIELSDYPKDRIELIIIDDGSTDDTWEHVNKAAGSVSMCGIRLRLLQHTINMGKRKAIQSGFATALGSIIISLDSDSVVEKGALRNIVSPLMKDPSIGAVAGHLAVLNISSSSIFSFKSLLPRLLDIVFDHIGNLPRSALSAEGFVTILPGAFSAFRADAVQSHIDRLCTSTFLGSPLKHGEDMELAYRILCDGWRTVYQSNAVVHTMAPETLEKALLMFSRWERTNYTFLCMGYPALTVQKTLKLWLAMRPRRVQSSLDFVDKEKQEDEPFITKDATGSISIYQRGMHLAERATDALGHIHLVEMCDSIPQTCTLDLVRDINSDTVEELHACSRRSSRKRYGICF
ncbi:nucleotide-diphospho-sugar transferase [Fusarium oxysporum]|nr:nucleotide-diphospho-sugar transferase [Fusarium oxysporum]